MARVERHVARKEKTCSKCHKTIEVGQEYLCGTPYKRPTVYRCVSCGLKSWELSGSEYIKGIANIVENWETDYPIDVDGNEDFISNIADDLESIKDDCEGALDNMPDNLRESSETGELLQNRIDQLEEAIDALNGIDYSSMEEDAKSEAESSVDEPDRDDYETGEEYNEAKELYDEEFEESWKNTLEENLREAIEDALSGLEY